MKAWVLPGPVTPSHLQFLNSSRYAATEVLHRPSRHADAFDGDRTRLWSKVMLLLYGDVPIAFREGILKQAHARGLFSFQFSSFGFIVGANLKAVFLTVNAARGT